MLSLLSDDDLTLDGAQRLPAGEHRGDHVVQPGSDVGQRQAPCTIALFAPGAGLAFVRTAPRFAPSMPRSENSTDTLSNAPASLP